LIIANLQELHMSFIVAAANLRAFNFGIKGMLAASRCCVATIATPV